MSDELQSESQKDNTICKLCRRQFTKYTCPSCNVSYCSLLCFRSPTHNQCSESFYKKEVEWDVRNGFKNGSDRMKTLELLKRFEEENANDLPLDDHSDGDDDDLAKRFASLDLEHVSSDEIWSLLTPEERKTFTKVMDNPESQLAQDLLSSEHLDKSIDEPWWESSPDSPDSPRPTASKPEIVRLPSSMLNMTSSHNLLYNTCAICIAYSFVTRRLGISALCHLEPQNPDYNEARNFFAQLIPFATDKKSEMLYENLSDVVTDFWSRFDPGEMTDELFSLLLRDAITLLRPSRIIEIAPVTTSGKLTDLSMHVHRTTLRVLSDIHAFYSDRAAGKSNHVSRKFLFYTAYITAISTISLDAVSTEISIMNWTS